MSAAAMEVPFTLPEGARPNAYVCATVVRNVEPDAKWRTHRAFGVARVAVDSAVSRLNIAINAPTEMRPAQTLDVSVRVTDPSGNAVSNAAVALVAVDEGVCQVSNFQTPDPLAYFWARRALGVGTADIYSELMPEIAKAAGQSGVGGGGDPGNDAGARHLTVVSARRVKPVALVSAITHTDSDGNATAHFQVPTFLGQLRVMAVAYAANQFGSSAKLVLVRAPIVAQSSFPRFAAPGDSFEVPVTIFNNTDTAGQAKLTLTLSNNLIPTSQFPIPPLTVPAHGQAIQIVSLRAAPAIGVARANLSVSLNSETFTDAEVELPIRPALPVITRAEYFTASPDKTLAVTVPYDMLDGTQLLDLRVTPQPTLAIPAGLDYLNRYPYGCLEQTTSTAFPLVYLPELGEKIGPGFANKEAIADKVQVGITRLLGMRAPDGGLSMWQGGTDTWQWGTVYATHFLVEASAAGHKVPDDFKARCLDYCRNLLSRSEAPGDMTETQAYAAYVLALAGKPDRVAMNRLSDVIAAESKAANPHAGITSARFFLAAAQLASGRKDLASSLIPENLPAPRTERQLTGNIGSSIRDQAVILNTLLAVDPKNPQVSKLAQQIANDGQHHLWYSTHDTAWAVMALGHYLRTVKDEKPFDSAELWQAGKKIAETDATKSLVYKSAPTGEEKFELRVKGDAASTAHLVWSLAGVPANPPADADHALKVRREYLTADDKPLTKLELAPGTLVKIRLTLENTQRLDHVVIEDLLPAGLEIENARLASSAKITGIASASQPQLPNSRLDVRDDRLILITSPAAGAASFTYLARAVSTGSFSIPPVRAECMYDPSINSLSYTPGKFTVTPVKPSVVAVK